MKEIAPGIYVSTEYPGVNVGFVQTPGGVIAVDAPTLPADARAWRRRTLEITGGPLLYVVLTDGHPDRLVSMDVMCGVERTPIVAAWDAYERISTYTDGFWRGVVDGWSRRCPEAAQDLARSSRRLPEIMFSGDLTLHKGGVDVKLQQVVGAAPGSVWVHAPAHNVLFTGDTLVVGGHPFMMAAPDTRGWLETLTALRRVRYAQTIIVPGRGAAPCDQEATRPLSDYLTLVRRRIRTLHRSEHTRTDVAALVSEMLPFFPVADREVDWVQRRVKAGIEQIYEEMRPK
jgi:glyoxylase-like metal-dependent hydrolase (beta-lactamase superfamily II)